MFNHPSFADLPLFQSSDKVAAFRQLASTIELYRSQGTFSPAVVRITRWSSGSDKQHKGDCFICAVYHPRSDSRAMPNDPWHIR